MFSSKMSVCWCAQVPEVVIWYAPGQLSPPVLYRANSVEMFRIRSHLTSHICYNNPPPRQAMQYRERKGSVCVCVCGGGGGGGGGGTQKESRC